MKIFIPALTFIMLSALVACDSQNSNDASVTPSGASAPVLPSANTNVAASDTNSKAQAGNGQVALNPEHGKPGHRCDIAVGAPLNSPPTNQPAITTTPPPVTNTNNNAITVTPNNNSNAVTAGLNPQHGQPGHRCDIAVGAPLNSKPQQ
jgi:hypothetical protein